MPVVGEVLFIGELQLHGHAAITIGEGRLVALHRLDLEQAVFVDVRIHIDGIHRDDGREQRGPRSDEITGGRDRAADAPADRCLDRAVLELDFRAVLRRLGGLQPGLRLQVHRLTRLRLLRGDGFRREQRLHTIKLTLHRQGIRLGPRHLGPRGAQPGLKRALVDGEQHIPLLDHGPGLEMNFGDVAGHAGLQLHRLHRLDAPRELLPLDEFFLLNRCERHRSRRHLTAAVAARRRFATGGEEQDEWEEGWEFHEARWFWGGKLTSWLI